MGGTMANEPFGILVATFAGDDSATAALDRLKASNVRRGNAAVIRRSPDGTLKITETQDWGMGKAALIGAVSAIVVLVDDTMRMTAEQVLRDAGGQTVSGGLDADLATQIEDSLGASPEAG